MKGDTRSLDYSSYRVLGLVVAGFRLSSRTVRVYLVRCRGRLGATRLRFSA